jgi:hypothetical protein
VFLVEFGPADGPNGGIQWARKVGQFPPWQLEVEKDLGKALGENSLGFYEKGRACENEGFGVGALAYFRRIVEDLVRTMLAAKEARLAGTEQDAFKAAADRVRSEWSGSEAIDLVKDDLPPEARPGGANPLGILYADLSEGLHTKTEEDCAALAGELRELLAGLFLQLLRTRESRDFSAKVNAAQKRRSAPRGEGI